MSHEGFLYMLPKVDNDTDQFKRVEPIRILKEEFCGKKGDQPSVHFCGDFATEMDESAELRTRTSCGGNFLYLVTNNEARDFMKAYKISVKSEKEVEIV
jgi:hypothetical protein